MKDTTVGINPGMIFGLLKNKEVMNIVKNLSPEQMEKAVDLSQNVNIMHAFNPSKMTDDELMKFKSCATSLGIDGLDNATVVSNK